jgi:phosphonate ABC transporter permease subunit PhnE
MAVSASTEQAPTRRSLEELMREAERRGRIEIGRNLTIAVVVAVLVAATYRSTEIDPVKLVNGAEQMLRMLNGFVHPGVDIIQPGSAISQAARTPEGLLEHYLLQTLAIAVFGTFLGTVVAIPASFLAARNLMRVNPLGTGVYFLMRALMSVVRSIPTIFWALLFVTAISIGPYPGTLAIALFSFGLMSKLFSEAIEAIDWGQVEALQATGATPVQVVVHGVVPQVLPYMVAHLLYTFEVNVHSATILGLVGGGGVGFLFYQYIDTLDYAHTAMLLYVVVPMTMLIDYSSAAIRRRII